jgi:peptide deformylase
MAHKLNQTMAARERTAEQRMASESPDERAQEREAEVDDGPGEGAVQELDAQTRARRDAALAHIRKLGDPVLRASALQVDRFDAGLRTEIERMGQLMSDALGVGLAATQVGVLHRVLVYRTDPDEPLTALVNPVIEWRSEELAAAEEGCLSIPGVHVEVERPARIRVRARDVSGGELEIGAEGLEARVIQHEVDHLDGILILDRISREARREAMRELREAREGRAPESAAERVDAGDAAAV